MGQLREKMIRDLKTRGMSEHTIRLYLLGVRGLLLFCKKSAQRITIEEIQKYHLHLIDRNYSEKTINVYAAGIRFLYLETLGRNWNPKIIPMLKKKRTVPVILSRDEVVRLLNAIPSMKYRTLLLLIYASGLRISEAVTLKPQDINSKRMLIHVRNGKGKKERYTILSPVALEQLRHYWKANSENKTTWLFPGRAPTEPVNPTTVRLHMRQAKQKLGIHSEISIHSLRHCFATHLLESGVDIRVIQTLLGHRWLASTEIYTHVRETHALEVKSPLDAVAAKLNQR